MQSMDPDQIPLLEIKNLHFSYGEREILKGVQFSLYPGEIVSLLGLSGSGKTTLFKLITGLIFPEHGKIWIKNSQLSKASSPNVTYMRQEDLLLPWRTVEKNLLLSAELGKNKDKSSLSKQIPYLLEKVGLKNCEHLYPFQLSGGMKQRVSLARALLQNRPLLLLDEPFGSLDVIIREQLYLLLKEICDQFAKTLLFVTHDFRDAVFLSNRILLLKEGKITQEFIVSDDIRQDPISYHRLTLKIRECLKESIVQSTSESLEATC